MTIDTSGSDPHAKRIIIRTTIPEAWSLALDHLALDLGLSKQALVSEGALLVLRYHGRADGLGEPMLPILSDGKQR